MKIFKSSFFILLVFFLICPAVAQQVPRIAILPFSPIGVSEAEAEVLTNLFEAAVVNTGVYEVIEQNQADRILDAQAYSLSSCTDEACAVEIGELLSAENIIIGSVSKLGEMFIVTAKIIDVTTGKNIRAASVQGMKIEEMTGQVNVLAEKLAGTASQSAIQTRAASEGTGEIFVHTVPADAEIFINGKSQGKSPLLLKNLPAGKQLLEAQKGPLYASSEVTISLDELLEITLTLDAAPGRLFIQTDIPSLKVFIDGKAVGPAASGLFKDIVPGQHELIMENDERYYKGIFSIEPGKTTELEISPLWLGTVKWDLPEAATASITGEMITAEYAGSGEAKLPSGSYKVRISGA
jgi:TolB-like protein